MQNFNLVQVEFAGLEFVDAIFKNTVLYIISKTINYTNLIKSIY